MSETPSEHPLMTPGEVSTLFRVSSKTVTRWADDGRLTSFRTLGGHRRFLREEVMRLKEEASQPGSES